MAHPDVIEARTAFEDYQVSPDRPVRLDVTVNHGQPGGVSVKVGSTTRARGATIRAVPLGKGRTLSGETLTIVAVAGRSNPATSKVGVQVVLKGGAFDRTIELTHDAELDGQVEFVVQVEFFE